MGIRSVGIRQSLSLVANAIELQCFAVSYATDTSEAVRPLLTTFVQIVVFNGVINVVDKKVPIAVRIGEPNAVEVTVP
jgi:hypothetical protein